MDVHLDRHTNEQARLMSQPVRVAAQ